MRRWPSFHEHHEADHQHANDDDAKQRDDVDVALSGGLKGLPYRAGKPDTMPAKISSEMPLPTPRSVICSPSHIMNKAPVTNVTIDTK